MQGAQYARGISISDITDAEATTDFLRDGSLPYRLSPFDSLSLFRFSFFLLR